LIAEMAQNRSELGIAIIVGRNNINGEFWAIASDEPTTLQTSQE
jgi:hypothetical protein